MTTTRRVRIREADRESVARKSPRVRLAQKIGSRRPDRLRKPNAQDV